MPSFVRNLLLLFLAVVACWYVVYGRGAVAQTPERQDSVQAEITQDTPTEKTPGDSEKSHDVAPEVNGVATKDVSEQKDKKTNDHTESNGESNNEDTHGEKHSDVNKTDEEESSESKKEDKPEKKSAEKPKPFKVERKPLKVEVKLDGYFVADEMEEIALRPEVWTKFKVLDAVPHGARVQKGEVLIRFDPEDLEKELAKETIEQRLSELALMQAEEEHPREKRLAEINFEAAKRSNTQLKEDFEYYQTTDRPFYVEIAHYRFKNAQEQLAAAREELKQLQQMYEADELTEETEEIVLRRQQFAVETAELIMELATADRDLTLNVTLPRRDEFFRTALEESDIAFDQAKTSLETGSARQVYEMEKHRQSRALSVERHAKLLSDKALMEIRAPSDGVVYYGRCRDGKWSDISTLRTKLKPYGTVSAKTVIMTIVKQRPLHVESSISEKDLPDMEVGLESIVSPVADDEIELTGKVTQLSGVPGKSNKFKILLDVDNHAMDDWLVAGMTCKAKVTTYENEVALQIPLDLVQTDEDNKKIKYIMLVDPDEEKPVRREVKLGEKQEKMVEVLEGLEEGDQIVKEEKKDSEDS